MKQIILFIFLFISAMQMRATELHTGNIILTFPCLAKGPEKSGDTEVYSGHTTQIDFQLQSFKNEEKNDSAAISRSYEEFIRSYIEKNKATLIKKENRKVNKKNVKYFSCTFVKDKTEYLSESIVYTEDIKTYHLNSIKKNDHIKLADIEIFFNSFIITK
ncbi:MAG: hypothetical protein JWN78_1501 [Bacteroidota bacterium]|nr:hypothetical protein [Bacteroidota bacterium]